MFDNVGGKIKGVIRFFFGLMIVVVVGIAIWIMILVGGMVNWFVGLLAGGATFGIGFLIAWLSSLTGYAFGQLVENTDNIREMLQDMEDENVVSILNTNSNTQTNQGKAARAYNPASNTPVYGNTTYVTCPSCKESQPAGKSYCNICGAKMNSSVPISTPAKPLEAVGNAAKTSGESRELITCPKCGELQPRGMNYCQVCGGKIPTVTQ